MYSVVLSPPLLVQNMLPGDLFVTMSDPAVYAIAPPPSQLQHSAALRSLALAPEGDAAAAVAAEQQRLAQHGVITVASQYGASVHNVQPFAPIALALAPRNMLWSAQFQLEQPSVPNEACVQHVAVHDVRMGQALELSIETVLRPTGTVCATVFCPYWLVNNSGYPMLYREHRSSSISSSGICSTGRGRDDLPSVLAAGHFMLSGESVVHMVPASEEPFMFSAPHLDVKVGSSAWSKDIMLKKKGTLECLEFTNIAGAQCPQLVPLAVSVNQSPVYWRTKLVQFRPWFTVTNKTGRPLVVGQRGFVGAGEVRTVPANATVPFSWVDGTRHRLMAVAMPECVDARGQLVWSSGFPIDRVDAFAVKIRARGGRGAAHFVSVRIRIEDIATGSGSSTGIVLSAVAPSLAPYRIENTTTTTVFAVHQKGCTTTDIVQPGTSLPYCWDENTFAHVLVVHACRVGDGDADVVADADGEHRFTKEGGEYDLDVFCRHPTTTLHDAHAPQSPEDEARPRHRATDSMGGRRNRGRGRNRDTGQGRIAFVATVFGDGPTRVLRLADESSTVARSAPKRSNEDVFSMQVTLQAITVSVMDSVPQELLFVSLDTVAYSYSYTESEERTEFFITDMQIDNQLYNTPYPVMLLMKEPAQPPFFHLSVVKKRGTEIQYYRYLSFLMQEVSLFLEETLVYHLIKLGKEVMANVPPAPPKPAVVLQAAPQQQEHASDMCYFELLHLNPVKIFLSFKSSPGGTPSDGTIARLLQVSTGVMHIENAVIRLNLLLLRDPFVPREEIVSRIVQHYRNQLLSQIYRLLGSFDIIGSPVSLVETLGTGVFDFFHEPAEGLVHSPKAFGKGLAVGTMSLLNNTVYGLFNTAAKISGSVTQGLASMSFDPEYLRARELAQLTERPRNVGDGLVLGAKNLGKGFVQGLAGVVAQPVSGGLRAGTEGFLKGVGRGVVGAVVKPMVGIMDFFSKTTEGVRNATTVADRACTGTRRRLPRNAAVDGIIEPYAAEAAEGCCILYQFAGGRYIDEQYVFHVHLVRQVLLGTRTLLLLLDKRAYDYRRVWRLRLTRISGFSVSARDRMLVLHYVPKKAAAVESAYSVQCPTAATLALVQSHIENVLQLHQISVQLSSAPSSS